MKRLIIALATAGLLAIPATGSAATTPTPSKIASCQAGGPGVTYSGTLTRYKISTPDGLANVVAGGENFVIVCPPLSGSVTIELQYRVGSSWSKADDARYNFPAPRGTRGFGLAVGPYYCQGTKTSWRIAIFSSGVAGDGTPWGPSTDWDSAIGGSSGRYFDCTK